MISEHDYIRAKEIISQYEKEKEEERNRLNKEMEIAQRKREEDCKEHYFLDDGKWTSTRTCQFCGKQI